MLAIRATVLDSRWFAETRGVRRSRLPACAAPGAGDIALRCADGANGGVAERLKAHAWKVCMRETVSRVRIPPPPPRYKSLISDSHFLLLSPFPPLISDPCGPR